jgi:hypothetical protein
MKTTMKNQKPMSLVRTACSIAAACMIGLPLAAHAQYMEDDYYGADIDNAPQISRSVDQLPMGRTVQTQAQGTTELSIGASHERSSVAQGSQRFSEIKARAEVGLTDRLQLEAELPYQIDDRPGSSFNAQENVGNVQIGGTYSLLRADDPISMSAGLDVQIPVGHQAALPSRDLRSSDQTLWKPSLIIARDFGPMQVHTNMQAELGSGTRGFNYDISGVYPVGRVAPSLELNARTLDNATPQFYATPGLTYSFSDRTKIGVGVPIGLNDQSTEAAVVGRFSLQLR